MAVVSDQLFALGVRLVAAVSRYVMQNANSPATGKDGVLAPNWQRYLRGLEDVSGRVALSIDPLAGAATLPQTVAKLNELIAAMQLANQMET